MKLFRRSPQARCPKWTLLLACALSLVCAGPDLRADERPQTSKAVRVPAQGADAVAAEAGAPPSVQPSTAVKPVRASVAPGLPADAAKTSLRALSLSEGEATLEIDGVREVVRPGSRLGTDTVKTVTPGRIVLEREARAGGGVAALVIVTFDASGQGRSIVFWASDPAAAAPASAEVKQP